MTGELRIGDAEREQAAAALGEHYALGRLDTDEHAERLDAAWTARTRSDLDVLFEDLPGPEQVPARRAPARWPAAHLQQLQHLPPLPLAILMALGVLAVVSHLPVVLLGLLVWWGVSRARSGGRPGSRRTSSSGSRAC